MKKSEEAAEAGTEGRQPLREYFQSGAGFHRSNDEKEDEGRKEHGKAV